MSINRLFHYVALGMILLLAAACSAQAQPENGSESRNPEAQVAAVASENLVAEPHKEDDNHTEDGQGDAAEAPMAEGMHVESDSHAGAEHMEGDEHSEEGGHAEGEEHGVPADAMTVENLVAATEESIAAGAAVYTQYCAVCHGNEGKGDGPGAAGLTPKPADFSAEHVQVLSDGGLYWFITNGVPNSAMPPWGSALSEQQRWEVVNFLRTFKQE